jgi:hypothetical protein
MQAAIEVLSWAKGKQPESSARNQKTENQHWLMLKLTLHQHCLPEAVIEPMGQLRPESLAFWALAKALHMFRRLCFFPIVDCTRVRPS